LVIFFVKNNKKKVKKRLDNYQIDKKISFADISIVYDWLYYNCELISFDKQQLSIFNKLK